MQVAKMKSWLNYFLIVILFFSGMCFDTVKVDSYSRTSNHSPVSTLQLVEGQLELPDFCTSEQLGASTLKGAVEVLSRNVLNQKIRLRPRIGAFFSILEILPENFHFYKANDATGLGSTIVRLETVIIAYIHHQDGEKG